MSRYRRDDKRRLPAVMGCGGTLLLLAFVAVVVAQRTGLARLRPSDTAATLAADGLVAADVVRVIDGDTIVVSVDGQQYRLRYIGIDTPEMEPTPEPFALEAAKTNENLLAGRTVYLEKDVSETDRYGRLLRYVWLDGSMVNEMLVSWGMARAVAYPPDVRYHDRLLDAQREAQENHLGMWARPTVAPSLTLDGALLPAFAAQPSSTNTMS